jgi:hypothetical protein
VRRTQVVTQADLEAMNAALEALDAARDAVTTVQDACREKDDSDRVGRCKIAKFRLAEARTIIEHAFR